LQHAHRIPYRALHKKDGGAIWVCTVHITVPGMHPVRVLLHIMSTGSSESRGLL